MPQQTPVRIGFSADDEVGVPDWVRREPDPVTEVPVGYKFLARAYRSRLIAPITNTIVRGTRYGASDEMWQRVCDAVGVIFNRINFAITDDALLKAELSEQRKTTVMGSQVPGFWGPELRDGVMLDTEPFRYAHRWHERDVAFLNTVPVSERIDLDDLRSKDFTTNTGWPFFVKDRAVAAAAVALYAEARSYDALTSRCAEIAKIIQGVDVPVCSAMFTRARPMSKPVIEYAYGTDGVLRPSAKWIRLSTLRKVKGRSAALNECGRPVAKTWLRWTKKLIPAYQYNSHESIFATQTRLLGSDNSIKYEGDQNRMDYHVSRPQMEQLTPITFEYAVAMGMSKTRAVMAADDWQASIGELMIRPSSRHRDGVVYEPQQGLGSGNSRTSEVGNRISRELVTEAWMQVRACSWEDAADDIIAGRCPAMWFGDDYCWAEVKGKGGYFSDAMVETCARYDYDLEATPGRTFLRTFDGHMLISRALWRSIDFERHKTDVIADFGAGVRFQAARRHPCFRIAWEGYNDIRRMLQIRAYDTPEGLTRSAWRRMTDDQRRQAVEEYRYSTALSAVVRDLVGDPDYIDENVIAARDLLRVTPFKTTKDDVTKRLIEDGLRVAALRLRATVEETEDVVAGAMTDDTDENLNHGGNDDV